MQGIGITRVCLPHNHTTYVRTACMKNDTENHGLTLPARLFWLGAFIFVIPVLAFLILVCFACPVSAGAKTSFVLHPVSVIFLLAGIALPLVLLRMLNGRIAEFHADYDKINDYIRIYARAFIFAPLAFALVFSLCLFFFTGGTQSELPALAFFAFPVGSAMIFSLFVYELFIHRFYAFFSWCPISQNKLALKFATCNTLISVCSLIGVVAIAGTILFSQMNALSGGELTLHIATRLLPVGIVCVAANFLTYLYQGKNLTARITSVLTLAEHIAARDYTLPALEILSRDEFGVLAANFNVFVASLKKILRDFINSQEYLSVVTDELVRDLSNSEQALENIDGNVNNVKNLAVEQSAGVEETHATVLNIVKGLEKLNRNIESQSASLTESSASIEQMVANIRSVTETLAKNTESITALETSASEGQHTVSGAVAAAKEILSESAGLLEASSVIQNIASQTNLLAMNAAIEAAHAGEAGKGFAVVADEIRKLAEESNVQGKSITKRLKALEKSIDRIASNTQDVEVQFKEIFDKTNAVKSQSALIKSAMDEQSAGSGQVLTALHELNDITEDITNGSSEMLEGSRNIADEMGLLAEGIKNITASMNEVLKYADMITQGMKNQISHSDKTARHLARIKGDTANIKLS